MSTYLLVFVCFSGVFSAARVTFVSDNQVSASARAVQVKDNDTLVRTQFLPVKYTKEATIMGNM